MYTKSQILLLFTNDMANFRHSMNKLLCTLFANPFRDTLVKI